MVGLFLIDYGCALPSCQATLTVIIHKEGSDIMRISARKFSFLKWHEFNICFSISSRNHWSTISPLSKAQAIIKKVDWEPSKSPKQHITSIGNYRQRLYYRHVDNLRSRHTFQYPVVLGKFRGVLGIGRNHEIG